MNETRFQQEDFNGFLHDLLKGEFVDGAAAGITKLVIDKGYSALTDKQKFVFNRDVIDEYTYNECARCPNEIPWCEMYMAMGNGGMCSWCDHMQSKPENN